MRRGALRWPLASTLGWLTVASAWADTPPTVPVRVGNHEGYGRIVFRVPPHTGYSVTQDGQRIVVKFSADLTIGQAPAVPHNVLGIAGGANQAELVLAPGAALHDWRQGDLVVIDVLDPAPAGKPAAPAAAAPATTTEQPAQPAAPPSQPPAPVAAKPLAPPPQPEPPPPGAQPQPPQPAAAAPQAPPSEPVPPVEAGDGLLVRGDSQLGVAAFRRGNSALIVFDERRDIDVTPLRDDPVFGSATVQVQPTATVVRMPIDAAMSLSLTRSGDSWHIVAQPREPTLRPIQATAAEDRLVLLASASGSVVTVADPDSGGTLLVGTQRHEGQGVPVERRSPEFALLPSWQGVAVAANADTVALRATPDGFTIAGTVDLSPLTAAAEQLAHAVGLTRRFDFPDQPPTALLARLRGQVAEAAAAPPLARGPRRQAAAQTMIALGLGAEADALLQMAAADDPSEAGSLDNAALTGIAALLAHRPDEADGLEDAQLPATDDVALWRAVRLAERQNGSPQAAAAFAATLPMLLTYPPQMRDHLLPLVAETLVAGGELAAAAGLLDARKDDNTLDLARAMLREARDDSTAALSGYDRLAQSRDQSVHARAAVRALELRLATGAIDVKQAAEGLESLLYAWRGDQRERAVRERLAELKARAGAWRSALALLRDTEALFPDEKTPLHAELADMFAAMLREDAGDALAPLEFVSVVEENADVLPVGPDGDALQAKLADRLLALDLPKRAGPVLEKLMQAASSDVARAGFGARLAALRLREGDAAGALAALDASVAADLPADLVERRTLLAAGADARRGDNERALALLATLDSAAADEARATMLERANDWPAAQQALSAYVTKTVPAEGKLDDAQRRTLLRLATAIARAGDDAALTALRQRESARMESGPLADMFRLLTADPVRGVADLKRSGQEAALARALPGQLKALQPPAGQTP